MLDGFEKIKTFDLMLRDIMRKHPVTERNSSDWRIIASWFRQANDQILEKVEKSRAPDKSQRGAAQDATMAAGRSRKLTNGRKPKRKGLPRKELGLLVKIDG